MITVTKLYRTETGHRLMNYDGKCAHLHGHSYLWEVCVGRAKGASLTDNGMVVDFKDVKLAMKRVLEPLDHAMVLHKDDPLLAAGFGTPLLDATNGTEGRIVVWPENPTAESFSAWALVEIQKELVKADPALRVVFVKVWETATSHAIA